LTDLEIFQRWDAKAYMRKKAASLRLKNQKAEMIGSFFCFFCGKLESFGRSEVSV
jgi:hypothetical protein